MRRNAQRSEDEPQVVKVSHRVPFPTTFPRLTINQAEWTTKSSDEESDAYADSEVYTESNVSEVTDWLFILPVELRIMVWEMVLIKENTITIYPGKPEPQLLQADPKIAREASGIYYAKNSFRLRVHRYDIEPFLPFFIAADRCFVSSAQSAGVTLHWDVRGNANWANLVEWVQAMHSNRAVKGMSESSDHTSASYRALSAFFDAVYKLLDQDIGWDALKRALAPLRMTLAASDPSWLR